jgi:hypothetical protein
MYLSSEARPNLPLLIAICYPLAAGNRPVNAGERILSVVVALIIYCGGVFTGIYGLLSALSAVRADRPVNASESGSSALFFFSAEKAYSNSLATMGRVQGGGGLGRSFLSLGRTLLGLGGTLLGLGRTLLGLGRSLLSLAGTLLSLGRSLLSLAGTLLGLGRTLLSLGRSLLSLGGTVQRKGENSRNRHGRGLGRSYGFNHSATGGRMKYIFDKRRYYVRII